VRLLSRADRRLIGAAPRAIRGFTSEMAGVDGVRLHIRQRTGTTVTDGSAWVLLHGLAVSHRYLMPTAAALPGPVFVPDLPGFGLSGKPKRVFNVEEHAGIIADWIDAAGIGPAHVLGNSFGCQVGVELAVRRPDTVRTLVLVGPTVDPAAPTAAGQARRLAIDLLREDPRQLPVIASGVRDAGTRRVLRTLRHSVRHHLERRLPLVAAPTLVLRGQHDPICPPSWAAQVTGLTPNATAGEIAGAAHNAVTTAGPSTAARAAAFAERSGRLTRP
jgi:pimeloyl-ACP methyl ester carboxylesterase